MTPTGIYRSGVLATAALGVLVLGGWLSGTPAVLVGSLAAFWIPGTALLALTGQPRSLSRDALLGPALSPILMGFVAAGAFLLDLPLPISLGAVLALGAVILVARVAPDPNADAVDRATWITGGFLALLVGAFLVPYEHLRITSDGLFHAAVCNEIARAGLPPDDPYFAGLPLQYFWFYHVTAMALGAVTTLIPTAAMALLNLVGALLIPSAAARVCRSLGFPGRSGVWAGLVILFGLGGTLWLFFPVKVVQGLLIGQTGLDQLGYLFPWPTNEPNLALRFLRVLFSMNFMLQKFLVMNAVPWFLLLSLLMVDGGLRTVESGRARDWALTLLAGVGALFVHTLLGGIHIVALGCAAALGLVTRQIPPRRALAVGAACGVALAAAIPYVSAITGGKQGGSVLPIGLDPWLWASLPPTLLGAFFLAWPALRCIGRRGTPMGFLFLAFLAANICYAIIARLPRYNQYDKPFLIVFLPLALAAGMGIPLLRSRWAHRIWRRRLLTVFLVLFLVPETLIGIMGFWGVRHVASPRPGEDALYEWIRTQTPRDAVFLDSGDNVAVAVRGARRLYWGTEVYAEVWQYPVQEMNQRRGLRDLVYSGSLTGPVIEEVGSLGKDVFVVAHGDEDRSRFAGQAGLRQVFSQGEFGVFRVGAEADSLLPRPPSSP